MFACSLFSSYHGGCIFVTLGVIMHVEAEDAVFYCERILGEALLKRTFIFTPVVVSLGSPFSALVKPITSLETGY